MACNFLTPRAMDIKAASDTLSEISETGTANSGWTSGWDSREDLRDLVAKIGLQDVSDLHQDRFRVDRKKLEHMLIGDNEAPEPADTFFHKIMEDTNTYVTWPSRLKIGAKSKKDPHVRIAGRPEDVQMAKERIMNVLNTRCNRVTMKMDVSYTDHSHIIGKEGRSIKRVMEETQCHVHFPDSNRSNATEKSNQVSIAGDIEGVERARSRVRNLTPLIFSFELPILPCSVNIPDGNTPYVVKVQEQYNVQVMFRTRPKLHATLVMVKGVEWEVHQVKQATLLLIEFMCENLANQISVQMSMEISPHHHPMVIGKNHSNLKSIIQNTNTQIMFPDAQDPNISSLKKSNVTISGNIHNVYTARQQMMVNRQIGSLPLVLMFDLPEDTNNLPIQSEQIAKIQTTLDVTINIRHKAKQNTMACIIKGIERCATNIYEARNRILGIRESCIVADIPTSYFPPQSCPNVEVPPVINIQPVSPLISPMVSPTWQYPPPSFNQSAPFVGMTQQPQFMYNLMHGTLSSSGYHSLGQLSATSLSPDHSRDGSTYSSISSTSPISSPMSSPRNSVSPVCHRGSTDSPISDNKTEISSILSEMSNSGNYHGPTLSKRSDNRQLLTPSDYEQKRIAGIRAMQNRPTGGYRVPTNAWAGYGISHTSPAMDAALVSSDKYEDIWKTPTSKLADFNFPSTSTLNSNVLNTSNFMDHTPTNLINRITTSQWPDLATMLTSIGLEKYIGLFVSHEIDLMTFPSLTDQDLTELGVTAFGARRKMLLMISELNKRSSPFAAAPGAERKNSSSTSSNHGSPRDTVW